MSDPQVKSIIERPHCQSPDRCGSYGSKHCDACIRAAGLTEALAYG